MSFEFISYCLAAVVSLVPVLFARRGAVPLRAGLRLACLVSGVWAATVAANVESPQLRETVWPFLAELGRAVGWQGLLIGLLWHDVARESSSKRGVAALLGVACLLWAAVAAMARFSRCGCGQPAIGFPGTGRVRAGGA